MLLNDIREVKPSIGIAADNSYSDKIINFYIEYASGLIEEFLGRGDLAKLSRVGFFAGNGKQEVTLPFRPLYPNAVATPFRLWHNRNGKFVDANYTDDDLLTYGEDYSIKPDEPDGTSRSGILIRFNAVWELDIAYSSGLLSASLQGVPGSYKVEYTAGYTVDNLPPPIRAACLMLVAKIHHILPFGMEIGSESYEERSISFLAPQRGFLMSLVRPMIMTYQNRSWGSR